MRKSGKRFYERFVQINPGVLAALRISNCQMTQEDFADAFGVGQKTLSRAEQGIPISEPSAQAIAKGLGEEFSTLFTSTAVAMIPAEVPIARMPAVPSSVDNPASAVTKHFDESIIGTVREQGHQRKLSVENINNRSLSELEQRLVIALDQLNTHTTAGFRASIENCEELLKQGEFGDACSAIALANINLGHTGFCKQNWDISIERARQILGTSLKWFPRLGSGYALRGLTNLLHDYDWDEADDDFVEALKCSPDNDLAHYFVAHRLVACGLFDAAVHHAHAAAQKNYRSPIIALGEPWMMLFAGRIPEAVTKLKWVVGRFGPSAAAQTILGDAYCAAGTMHKALEQYGIAMGIEFKPHALSSQGFVYGRLGRKRDALRCLRQLQENRRSGVIEYVSSWHEALIYAGLDETEQALDALDRAFEERCDWLIHAAVEPRWRKLHCERFQDLLERIGIKKPAKDF